MSETKNPRNAGRKPLPEDKKMKPWSGMLRPDQLEYIRKKGGAKFVRQCIDERANWDSLVSDHLKRALDE